MNATPGRKHKTIRRYHQAGDLHELTFSCHLRQRLLTNDTRRNFLAESVDFALEKHQLCLSAFVFMPEHVHLLVWPQDPAQAEISQFLKSLKQSCSTKIKHDLRQSNSSLLAKLTITERPGKQTFRFWQAGPGYDRNLNTPDVVLTSIDYIHNNPLRRSLCQRPEDWKWSSYRTYLADERLLPLTSPKVTSLPAEFLQ